MARARASRLLVAALMLHLVLSLAAIGYAASGSNATGLKRLGYAFATILVLIGGIAYTLGRSDIAKSSWAWAVVVAVATAWALSHVGTGIGGRVSAELACPPRSVYTELPVYVVVTGPPGNYTVDWGDGSTSVCSIAPGGYYCAVSHSYGEQGNYTITASGASGSCGVEAISLGSALEKAISESVPRSCGGNVFSKSFWSCLGSKIVVEGFAKVYGVVLDLVSKVVGHGGGALDKLAMGLITVPESVHVYSAAHAAALRLLGYAVVVAAAWRAYWEFEKGLSWLDALREIAFAGLALALIPDVYTAVAKVVNSVAIAIGQPGQALSMLVTLLSMAILWAVLPVGGAGVFAGMIMSGAAMLGLVALLKYLTVWAIMSVYPLIVLLWLIPFTRSIARTMAMTVIGVMAWSLVVAGMTGALATLLPNPMGMSPIEAVLVSLATPLAILASGVGVLGGLFALPVPGAGIAQAAIAGIAARIGLATKPQAIMLAAPGQVVGHTEYLRPPIHPTPAGAAVVGVGAQAYPGVQTPTPPAAPAKTEWIRPQQPTPQQPPQTGTAGPAATSTGAAAGPTAEQVRTARRVYEAGAGRQVPEAWRPSAGEAAEAARAIQRTTGQTARSPRIEELPAGRKWEAVRKTGAALGRLEAYFENRARQFAREFAIAFEARTGIRVPDRLKNIRQLDRLDTETRKYIGARYAEQATQAGIKLGKTIYIRIKKPIASMRKTNVLGQPTRDSSSWY